MTAPPRTRPAKPAPARTPAAAVESPADPYRGGLRVAFEAGAHLTVDADGRSAAVEWAPRSEGDPMPWRTLFNSRHFSAQIAVTRPGDPSPVPLTTDELTTAVRRAVGALSVLTITPDPRRPGVFVLVALTVRDNRRNQGHESRAMRMITDWAELYAATLIVPPSPTRPDRWLRGHRFLPAEDGTLVRRPARVRPTTDLAPPAVPTPRQEPPMTPPTAPVVRARTVDDVYGDLRQARADHADVTARIAHAEDDDDPELVEALEAERDGIADTLVRAALELDDLARTGHLPAAWHTTAAGDAA